MEDGKVHAFNEDGPDVDRSSVHSREDGFYYFDDNGYPVDGRYPDAAVMMRSQPLFETNKWPQWQ